MSPLQSLESEKIGSAAADAAGPLKSPLSDFEKGDSSVAKLSDGLVLVDWEGPSDPQCAKNWSKAARWTATVTVGFFTLLAPLTSTITAPAEDQISAAFGVEDAVLKQMETSIFVLAFAFGPILFGPLSELYGRRIVLQTTNAWYTIFNLVCAFAPNATAFYIFRFLAGLGGSAPLSIGGGTVGDVWRAEERGLAMATYALAPLLGPSFGPIIGAAVAQTTSWKWCFWSTSIFSAAVHVAGLLFLQETYEPVILQRKARRLRKENPHVEYATRYDAELGGGIRYIVSKGLSWPFKLLVHENILQWITGIQAIAYGLIYVALTTIPSVYQNVYGESIIIAGLHYIATALGFIIVAQVQGRLLDPLYRRLVAKHGKGRPEFRLPPLYLGAALIPIGFLMFGFGAENRVQWIVPDIGLFAISGGMISVNQVTQTYVIDCYAVRAASALSVVYFTRALLGFGLPLATPYLFQALNYAGGCAFLAGLSCLFTLPAAPFLWRYGPTLRARSKYAKKDD